MAKDDVELVSEPGEPEEWMRNIEDDLRGVEAIQVGEPGDWPWQVGVAMAEFVRDDPLEGEMRAAVAAAIRSVPGVDDVAEEDREVWIVEGSPRGDDLVRAVAEAVDGLVERAEALMDAME